MQFEIYNGNKIFSNNKLQNMTPNQSRRIRRRAYTAAKVAYDCVAKAIDKIARIEKEADPETADSSVARSAISGLRKELTRIASIAYVNKSYLDYYKQTDNDDESKN